MPAGAQTAPVISADFAIGGGRFYAQANGGSSNTGFAVTDDWLARRF